jgi:sarcosine oxidase
VQAVDVVVVGAGIMGSATAWRLALAGADVALLERFEIGHRHGSSHGASRIFRLSYPDPTFVRMAQEALPLWRELEAVAGETLLEPTGGLDTGADLDGHAAALAACGAPFELLTGAEAMARFSGIRIDPDARLIHQPDGATIAADRTWHALADTAVGLGAEVHLSTPVRRFDITGAGVEVHTSDETYQARVAVVTAGGWSRQLLAGVGIDLPTVVTRETVAYFTLPDDQPIPTFVEWGSPATYALRSPGEGIKVGQHRAALPVQPDEEGEVSEQSVGYLSAWVAEHYPGANPVPHHAETCLYTNTVDEHFILERYGPIVVGSACSGHGFKFAPLVGQRLAELARS